MASDIPNPARRALKASIGICLKPMVLPSTSDMIWAISLNERSSGPRTATLTSLSCVYQALAFSYHLSPAAERLPPPSSAGLFETVTKLYARSQLIADATPEKCSPMQTEATTSAFYESLNAQIHEPRGLCGSRVKVPQRHRCRAGWLRDQSENIAVRRRLRRRTAVLSVCVAPFTLLHALSLGCAAEAELPLLKNRASLKHRQFDGDHDLTWVSSPQSELQKI
jgi:hypothetical protein